MSRLRTCSGSRGQETTLRVGKRDRSKSKGCAYFGIQSHALFGHLGFEKEHLEQLVRLVSIGRLDVSRSITEVIPLEQAPRGVERLATKEGNPIRLVVAP